MLYAAGRTRAVAASVGGAAVLNLVLNLLLIPLVGVAGAAVATLVSYAVLAVVTARLAEASTPAAYPWPAIALVAALTAGLWALGVPSRASDVTPRLALRAGLALAYLPGLVAVGVYGRDDWTEVRAAWQRRREHGGSTPPTAAAASAPGDRAEGGGAR